MSVPSASSRAAARRANSARAALVAQQRGCPGRNMVGVEPGLDRDAQSHAAPDAQSLITRDGHRDAGRAARQCLQQRRTAVRHDEARVAHEFHQILLRQCAQVSEIRFGRRLRRTQGSRSHECGHDAVRRNRAAGLEELRRRAAARPGVRFRLPVPPTRTAAPPNPSATTPKSWPPARRAKRSHRDSAPRGRRNSLSLNRSRNRSLPARNSG